ncbi:MAG: hypothetical protein R3C53_09255 [Pirellulaceae bacterium]
MAIDHYSPCPCGSGKKMKFCKCVENPQDFEKIVKLIEGGQEVAALDRINQLLKKTPNAAWLLAIKGELTLGMQELDSFRETASRFLKLKPDNPMALLMMAVGSVFSGEPQENTARYLLQGMAESRESLPLMGLNAIQLLLQSLTATGRESMAGYWAEVLSGLTGQQSSEESLLLDPSINLLAKSAAKIVEDPPGAPWKERLAEVQVLARAFRYDQAEKKLQAILRDFPGQPGPLSHLFRAQYAQLEQTGAFETARKLAENLEVPAVDRAYFAAIALEIEPDHASLKTPTVLHYCTVESLDLIEQSLATLDFVKAISASADDDALQYFGNLVGDEIPARRLYNILDRSVKENASTEPGAIVSAVGNIVCFAKQTDRPARVLFFATAYPGNQSRIDQVLECLQLGPSLENPPTDLAAGYYRFLGRARFVQMDDGNIRAVAPNELGPLVVEEFLNLPIELLNNQSPLEAVQDERQRAKLLGLLCHLEGQQSLVVEADVIDKIYQRLALERPKINVSAQGAIKLSRVTDLERIDITQIGDDRLKGLTYHALEVGAARVCYRCAKAIQASEELFNDPQLRVIALSNLMAHAPSLEEKLEYNIQLEAALAANGQPVGRVILQRLSLLQGLERMQEAEKMLLESAQKYPDDPYLQSFFEYAMRQGMAGGGPNPMGPPGEATLEDDSGLVLPGQSSSPAGESKLWLPGS